MLTQAVRDISKKNHVRVIELLKKSGGMTVPDMAEELRLSYMGVKSICADLMDKGYAKTKRLPRTSVGVGRPQKLYQLERSAESFFPEVGVPLVVSVMNAVQEQYGESAPEKLLYHYFLQKKNLWFPKLKGAASIAEKAERLVKLREKDGCFNKCMYDRIEGYRIEESHHPLWALYREFPLAARFEVQMMEQLLLTEVKRTESKRGGIVLYKLDTL